jgi:hypothetical protein
VLALTACGRFRGFIRFLFLNQGLAAAVAEIAVRRVCFAAVGAGYFKSTAAFVAEAGIGGIIRLAFGTLYLSFTIRRNIILLCDT